MNKQEELNLEANQVEIIDGVIIAVREKVKKRKGVIISKKYLYTVILDFENGKLIKSPYYYEFEQSEMLNLEFGARVRIVITKEDITMEQAEQLANEE